MVWSLGHGYEATQMPFFFWCSFFGFGELGSAETLIETLGVGMGDLDNFFAIALSCY